MTDEIRDALDEFTPSPDDEPLDWGEVLRRAQRFDAPDAWSRNGHVPHAAVRAAAAGSLRSPPPRPSPARSRC